MSKLISRCIAVGALSALAIAGAGVATASAASAAPPANTPGIVSTTGASGIVTLFNKTDEPIEVTFTENGHSEMTILPPNDSFDHVENANDQLTVTHVGGGDPIIDATFYGGHGWTGTTKFGVTSKITGITTMFTVRIPAIQ